MPYDTKVEGETTRSTVVMHTVLPQIANYQCLIAIHGGQLKYRTLPPPHVKGLVPILFGMHVTMNP